MKQHEREASQTLINYLADHHLTSSEPFRHFIKATGLATGIIFRQGMKGYALDLYHPDTIDAHPRGLRTHWGTEGEALRELEKACGTAKGNRTAWTSAAEYGAAQELIDYLAEHYLANGEAFRNFIKAIRLATGTIFEDADGYGMDIYAPGTIADFPHGHRTSWDTREEAEQALARIKAGTTPWRNSYAGMTLEAMQQAHAETGHEYYCDGDLQRWIPEEIFTANELLIRA